MEKSTRNVLIAAGAGLAVGAIAGILFAPAKGSETRANIADKYNDLKDKVVGDKTPTELIADLKNTIESTVKTGSKNAKNELLEQINSLESTIKN